MFSEFVEVRAGEAGRKSWAIVFSTILQATGLLALLLMPLLFTGALPMALPGMKALLALPTPIVEPPKPPNAPGQIVRQRKGFFSDGVLRAPRRFPHSPLVFQEPELPPELPADARGTDYNGADLFNYLAAGRSEAEPLPVVAAPIQRIRRTEIQQAMILAQPQPAYPRLAVIARIQGDVTLHAIIDKEGRVAELEVISGHPLLVKAALTAVAGWRYRPTLLNGDPTEVETTIKVSFVLGR